MPGLASQQVGSILPSWLATAWPAVVATFLVGVFAFFLWEGVAKETRPEGRDVAFRWLVILPTAGLLLMGVGAAVGASLQATWYARCVRTGFPDCLPSSPALYIGTALWIPEAAILPGMAFLAASGRAARILRSRAFVVGCTAVLMGNLLAFMVASFFVVGGVFYPQALTVALETTEIAFVNTGLLVPGLLTLGGFQDSEWGTAARLLAWLNLVPAGFLALIVGSAFSAGGGLPFAVSQSAFF